MPRISILNFLLGYLFIFLSASGGFFLSEEYTMAHLQGGDDLQSWWLQIAASAHGHTNLFGMLHILLGLTIPYSFKSRKIRVLKTVGLFLGSLAMSFLLYFRAYQKPTLGYDFIGILIGVCLSGALFSIGLQIFGLILKLRRVE